MTETVIQVDAKEPSSQASFLWSNVSYTVKVKDGKNQVDKPLLQNMFGEVKAGEVVAIMGGSG